MKHARRSISRGSVRDALSALCGLEDASQVFVPVIQRGNEALFKAAITRVQEIPPEAMKYLIEKPNMLRLALAHGLDPNTKIEGRLATEVAARKHMYASLKELFKCPNVQVTRYVVNRLQNNIPMYTQAIEHAPAIREDVVNAIRVRSNALLQRSLHKLKQNENEDTCNDDSEDVRMWTDLKWAEEVEEKLRCPILLQATAEPVKAPSGHIYDADSIYAWVHSHGTNPMTRQPLCKDDLVSVGATILGKLLKGVIH